MHGALLLKKYCQNKTYLQTYTAIQSIRLERNDKIVYEAMEDLSSFGGLGGRNYAFIEVLCFNSAFLPQQ
jgi:hypothetical protein